MDRLGCWRRSMTARATVPSSTDSTHEEADKIKEERRVQVRVEHLVPKTRGRTGGREDPTQDRPSVRYNTVHPYIHTILASYWLLAVTHTHLLVYYPTTCTDKVYKFRTLCIVLSIACYASLSIACLLVKTRHKNKTKTKLQPPSHKRKMKPTLLLLSLVAIALISGTEAFGRCAKKVF